MYVGFPFIHDYQYANDGLPSYIICDKSNATHVQYYTTSGSEPYYLLQHSGRFFRQINGIDWYPNGTGYPDMWDIIYDRVLSKWGSGPLYVHDIDKWNPGHHKLYLKLKTEHGGNLGNSPQTAYYKYWIGAGGITHTVTENLIIPDYMTLTIKTGATVVVKAGKTITVNGKLTVEGTSEDPIVFKGENGAKWERWFFINL